MMVCQNTLFLLRGTAFVSLLLGIVACGPDVPAQTPTLVLPTSQPPAPAETATADQIEIAPTDTAAPPSSPTTAITATATEISITNTPVGSSSPTPAAQAAYAVTFVETNDVLNVRSGPGVAFGIVGTLPPDGREVQITGSGQQVAGSTWVPVQRGATSGWVNSRYLTPALPEDTFCTDAAVTQLLDRLETAVAGQDNLAMARLIHPERGLRVRLLWYEAETWLDNVDFFSDSTSYNWGLAAGSGEPIVGPVDQILLPRLQADFLDTTETACNEILHGGTPGLIVWPDSYTPVNFYSFYRPGSQEYAGLNWGTWAIGLEWWEGQYYLSTLVHYEWEP